MNKKFRNILSLGAITMLTASSMLPVNALSKTCYKKVMTTKSVYIYVNGVKYKLPLTPSCPNVPSKPESTPNNPSTTPQQSEVLLVLQSTTLVLQVLLHSKSLKVLLVLQVLLHSKSLKVLLVLQVLLHSKNLRVLLSKSLVQTFLLINNKCLI